MLTVGFALFALLPVYIGTDARRGNSPLPSTGGTDSAAVSTVRE